MINNNDRQSKMIVEAISDVLMTVRLVSQQSKATLLTTIQQSLTKIR